MIVIDSSAFAKFLMKEENWKEVTVHFNSELELYAVDTLIVEITNVLWKYMLLYKLITEKQVFELYSQMMKLIDKKVIILDDSKKFLLDALKIAVQFNITVYDSLFLSQAKALNASLLTSDKRQRDIAQKIGIDSIFIT